MRLNLGLPLFCAAALAACGKHPAGRVVSTGLTPATSLQKDTRSLSTRCPGCGTSIKAGLERCPRKTTCDSRISWSDDYDCNYCHEGECRACLLMEQGEGKCYNCKGTGYLTYQGKTYACPNCKGGGKCPICKGTRKCDYCKGEGKLSLDDIKQRTLQPGSEEDAEKPRPEPQAVPPGQEP